jgi:hypothetical protein
MTRPDIPITFSANARSVDNAFKHVRDQAALTVSAVVGTTAKLRSGISGIAGLVASGPAGLVGSLGLSGLAAAVQTSVESVVELGRQAKTAGVNFRDFQELKYAADQNLVSVDALTDGLKELQLRADEFIKTGSGSGAESFQRLGLDAKALAEGLKDPAQLFETIIDRIRDLDKAAQIRVMDEIFGGQAAEQFAAFLDQGARSIRELRNEGEAFGVVMDEKFLRTAEEANRKFNALATVVGVSLKSAIVSAAESLYNFLDSFRDFQNQQDTTLRSRQAEIGQEDVDLEAQIMRLREQQRTTGDGLSDVAKNLGFSDSKNELVAGIDGQIAALEERRKKLADESAQIAGILNSRIKANERPAETPWTPIAPSSSSRDSSRKAARQERDAVQEVIASLQEEIGLIGKSGVEREKAIELRRAGVDAASAEGKQIAALVEKKYQESEAEKRVTEERERGIEAAERLGQTMDDQLLRIIDGTFDARDALASFVQALIDAATQGKGLFGSIFSEIASGSGQNSGGGDFFGSLFGSLFGGARAGGGDVSPGRIYRINEHGDEYFQPSSHGKVLPAGSVDGGTTVHMTFAPVFNAAGADASGLAEIRRDLAKIRKDMPGVVVDTVKSAQRRRIL